MHDYQPATHSASMSEPAEKGNNHSDTRSNKREPPVDLRFRQQSNGAEHYGNLQKQFSSIVVIGPESDRIGLLLEVPGLFLKIDGALFFGSFFGTFFLFGCALVRGGRALRSCSRRVLLNEFLQDRRLLKQGACAALLSR